MDLQAIAAAGASLRSAAEIAKTLLDAKTTVDIQGKVIELNQAILVAQQQALDAQQAQRDLVAENEALRAAIREMEDWSAEAEQFELVQIGSNKGHAYKRKDAAEDAPHFCAPCFSERRKSILQPHTVPEGRVQVLMCHACKSQVLMRGVLDTRMPSTPRAQPAPAASGRMTRF
jgi:hypothetical protein